MNRATVHDESGPWSNGNVYWILEAYVRKKLQKLQFHFLCILFHFMLEHHLKANVMVMILLVCLGSYSRGSFRPGALFLTYWYR